MVEGPLGGFELDQVSEISTDNTQPAIVLGTTVSTWYWKGMIDNFADGILTITISNPQIQNEVGTGVSFIY